MNQILPVTVAIPIKNDGYPRFASAFAKGVYFWDIGIKLRELDAETQG